MSKRADVIAIKTAKRTAAARKSVACESEDSQADKENVPSIARPRKTWFQNGGDCQEDVNKPKRRISVDFDSTAIRTSTGKTPFRVHCDYDSKLTVPGKARPRIGSCREYGTAVSKKDEAKRESAVQTRSRSVSTSSQASTASNTLSTVRPSLGVREYDGHQLAQKKLAATKDPLRVSTSRRLYSAPKDAVVDVIPEAPAPAVRKSVCSCCAEPRIQPKEARPRFTSAGKTTRTVSRERGANEITGPSTSKLQTTEIRGVTSKNVPASNDQARPIAVNKTVRPAAKKIIVDETSKSSATATRKSENVIAERKVPASGSRSSSSSTGRNLRPTLKRTPSDSIVQDPTLKLPKSENLVSTAKSASTCRLRSASTNRALYTASKMIDGTRPIASNLRKAESLQAITQKTSSSRPISLSAAKNASVNSTRASVSNLHKASSLRSIATQSSSRESLASSVSTTKKTLVPLRKAASLLSVKEDGSPKQTRCNRKVRSQSQDSRNSTITITARARRPSADEARGSNTRANNAATNARRTTIIVDRGSISGDSTYRDSTGDNIVQDEGILDSDNTIILTDESLLPIASTEVLSKQEEWANSRTVKRKRTGELTYFPPCLTYHAVYIDDLLSVEFRREQMSHKLSADFLGKNINAMQRKILVIFLLRLSTHSGYPSSVIYQAVKLFDVALDRIQVATNKLQLASLAALWITLKREENAYKVPTATTVIALANDMYEGRPYLLARCERLILTALDFNITFADPFSMFVFYARNCQRQLKFPDSNLTVIYYCGTYVIDLTLVEAEFCYTSASLLALTTAELVLRLILDFDSSWQIDVNFSWQLWRYLVTNGSSSFARFDAGEIDALRAKIIKQILMSTESHTGAHVVYKKYKRSRYGRISDYLTNLVKRLAEPTDLENGLSTAPV